jgi:hypothetical protein
MILERESVSGQQARPARVWGGTLALGAWLLVAFAVQSTVGADLARSIHDDEERLELHIRGRHEPAPANTAAPPRTNEESIDPWELVSV